MVTWKSKQGLHFCEGSGEEGVDGEARGREGGRSGLGSGWDSTNVFQEAGRGQRLMGELLAVCEV